MWIPAKPKTDAVAVAFLCFVGFGSLGLYSFHDALLARTPRFFHQRMQEDTNLTVGAQFQSDQIQVMINNSIASDTHRAIATSISSLVPAASSILPPPPVATTAALPAATPRHDPLVHVIVTGCSSNHFYSMRFFFQALAALPAIYKCQVIFYDLGLDPCEVNHLKDIVFPALRISVEYRVFPFSQYPPHVQLEAHSYAWKPIIIKTVVEEFGAAMWFDSGHFIVAPPKEMFKTLHRFGLFSKSTGWTVRRFTHPGMLPYFNISDEDPIMEKPCFDGSTVGFMKTNEIAMQKVLDTWLQCALNRDCITPPGSARHNHRQDQAALTLLMHRHGFGELLDWKYDSEVRNRGSDLMAMDQPSSICPDVYRPLHARR